MGGPKVVIDTNVFVAALRSSKGASFKLLLLLDKGKYQVQISVPLLLEYEYAAKQDAGVLLSFAQIDDILDYICSVASKREIFFLWRPHLKDPKDDFVLELAVESEAEFIITYNKQDFTQIKEFGIRAVTPKEFLQIIGEIK